MKIQLSAIFKFLPMFVFAASLTACGDKQDISEKSSKLLFSSTLDSLTVTGNTPVYAVLTARVLDETGKPLHLATIKFESDIGRLEKKIAETDKDGKVTLKFYPGNDSGKATISAFVNGLQKILEIHLYQENGSSKDVTSLSLTKSSATVVAGSVNRIKLIVLVKDSSGQANNGKSVTFSTTKGTLHADLTASAVTTTAVTNSDGEAILYLLASSQSGTANIRAFVEGFSASTSIAIVAGEADSTQSSISLTPATIPADGTTTTQVQVLLQDSHGNVVTDGNSVTLETAIGTITSTNPQTTKLGKASFTVQSSNTAGTGAITITGIAGLTATLTQTTPNNDVESLVLNSGNTQIRAGDSNRIKLIALVKGKNGQAVNGKSVTFSTTKGTLHADLTAPAVTTTAVTNRDGKAILYLLASSQSGTAKISTFVEGFSASTSIEIVAGEADSTQSSISLTPATIPADGTTTTQVQVLLQDSHGNVVTDGNSVTLETAIGTITSTNPKTTRLGRAIFTVQSSNTAGTGAITITGIAGLTATLTQTTPNNDVESLVLNSASTQIRAGDSNRIKLIALVKDSNGQAINGKSVTFSTTKGTLHADLTAPAVTTTAVTNSDGEAILYLLASSQSGTANISAFVEGFSASTSIAIVAGEADSTQSSISLIPATIPADGTTTTQVQVLLQDSHGNVVTDGRSVTLETAIGTITSTNPKTTTLGRAIFTVQSSNTAGTGAITITGIAGLTATLTQTTPNNDVESLVLSSANTQLIADGTSIVKITALVAGVENAPVSFSTNNGLLLSDLAGTTSGATLVANTDANGEAVLFLRSGTQATTARVSAFVEGFNANVNVDFIAGDVDENNSSIIFTPSTIPADGVSTSIVEVLLLDVNNNVVVDDTEVTLETTSGSITTENPAKTSLGRASFTLQSSNQAGSVTVSVFEYSSLAGQVVFGSPTRGEAFQLSVTPESNHVFVKGVGKKDSISIAIEVKDSAGNVIGDADDEVNNLRVSFDTSPQSGEELVGKAANGQVVNDANQIDVRTLNGTASVGLTAGTRPGVVGLRVEALDDAGNSLVPPVVANLSEISIASGPPHNIAVSYPVINSIENLGSGLYRRVGSLSVTDQYGNAVPDGTVINLGYLDSVIVSNVSPPTINVSPDTINVSPAINAVDDGNASIVTGDVDLTDNTNGGLDSATITRNDTSRTILANDRVLILNAQANDKSRFVSSVGTNTVTTNKDYNHTNTDLKYLVGSALLGGQVSGVDTTDGGTIKTGFATTESGTATFYITYPADSQTILVGAYGIIDTRFYPAGSAQTWLVAESNETGAATLDNRGDFAAIAPFTLTNDNDVTIISGTAKIDFSVADANGIDLPFVQLGVNITDTVNSGGLIVGVGDCDGSQEVVNAGWRTLTDGSCSLFITVTGGSSGDSAEVTISGAGESTKVTVSIL